MRKSNKNLPILMFSFFAVLLALGSPWIYAASSMDEVPAGDPAYQDIQRIYSLGWLDENAGQLAMSRILTRYEMALITLNAVDKVVYANSPAPQSVREAIGNLVTEFENEIHLFGSDFALSFKQFATRTNQQQPQQQQAISEVQVPAIGSISGSTTPGTSTPVTSGSEEVVASVSGDTTNQTPNQTPPQTVSPPSTSEPPRTSSTQGVSSGLSREDIERLIEEKVNERLKQSGGSSPSSLPYEIHGGTNISFLDRHVIGTPVDENGDPLEDEEGEVLKTDHRLSQNVWFDITAKPNENVRISTRLEAENPTGFLTSPTELELGAIRVVAETERTRLLLGTLEGVRFSSYTLNTNEDTRVDGIQANYTGDKFSIGGLAGRKRVSPVDEEGNPTGKLPSYLAAFQVMTDALIKGLKLSGNIVAQWDDAKWSSYVSDATPTSILTTGLAVNGEVIGIGISGEIATQVFDPDTTVQEGTNNSLAAFLELSRPFGDTDVAVNARYIGANHQVAGSDEPDFEDAEWIPGERGIGFSISRPFAEKKGNISFNFDSGVRYVEPEDEDEEGRFESGIRTALSINYGIPVTYGDLTLGSFNVSNTTLWNKVVDTEDDSIFTNQGSNTSRVSMTLEPVENWANRASVGFTYSVGAESDGTTTEIIDEKKLSFSYSTDYEWNPIDRLVVTPEYSFVYNKDFGLGETDAYRHQIKTRARYQIVPDQLSVNGSVAFEFNRVKETEFDDDGEPIEGYSHNAQNYRVGLTYTPSWLKGLSLYGTGGKRIVNYTLEDEWKTDENAWVFEVGAGYSGSLGPNGNWYANYGLGWNLDKEDIYKNASTQMGVGVNYRLGDSVTVSGDFKTQSDKSETTRTGSLSSNIDLGRNTSLGIQWMLQQFIDHEDSSNDTLVNEITANFSGQF